MYNLYNNLTLNDLTIDILVKKGYYFYDTYIITKNDQLRSIIIDICNELIKRKYNAKIDPYECNQIDKYLYDVLF